MNRQYGTVGQHLGSMFGMAVTSSHTTLGMHLPDFQLPDVVDRVQVSHSDFSGRPLLVIFMCNHCPYVRHVEHELARIGMDYAGRLGIIGVCSNDSSRSPGDAPDELVAQYGRISMTFPYLFDASQEFARACGAVCTPDIFLFDAQHELVYRGRIDGSRPGTSQAVTGEELRAALDAVLMGEAITAPQLPAMGCSIKWRETPDS